MAEVAVVGLSKRFGGVVALDDVTWTFANGRLTVLVGPSGCGKSTLLRLVAGLEEPTRGRVLFDGRDVTAVPAWERNAAMVFQSYALYPHMTVFANLAFPLQARRMDKGEIRRRVEHTARLLGIEALLARKPRQLSGGQMQRVALGRAMVREPLVYLMDEPLSNLDAQLRVEMRGEIKRLQRALGVTTIYVTHDQAEAMTMADTLLVMRGGRVEQAGDPEAIYRRPASAFVAGFIGSPMINLIQGRLDEAAAAFAVGAARIPLPDALRSAAARLGHRPLLLGVRPEDVVVSPAPQPEFLPARAVVREPLGKEALLLLAVDFLPPAALLRAIVPPDLRPGPDETVWLRFPPERLHLFDEATGAAVGW
ncbi:MAG: ABC transporter ATP-binding protein, partial [Anaerolineae bacterium]|nr:ABC transporter ATP-binding protein [Anaerolineae bacterium]